MENFQSRIYSINDFLEWNDRKQLEISPNFQRRSVWSPQAKSYLIATILQDKPLPKIFIRVSTDPKTRITKREVVDGQQRIRAILSFVEDGFAISRIHSETYGGLRYSDLPEEVQAKFLKYELSVDLLQDLEDRDVLDIFARLNTYSISLNKQELLNAKYFGYFKQLVYKLSGDFYSFWSKNNIFTSRGISRMKEAELMTDLIVAAMDGIQSKKNVEKYYKLYDETFEDREVIEDRVRRTINAIGNIFGERLASSEFRSTPNFYGLFVALYHMQYGIPNFDVPRKTFTVEDYARISNCLDEIEHILEEKNMDYSDFIASTKDATTDVPARTTRCEFIANRIYMAL